MVYPFCPVTLPVPVCQQRCIIISFWCISRKESYLTFIFPERLKRISSLFHTMLSIPEGGNDPCYLTYPYHVYLDNKHAETCKMPHPRFPPLIISVGCIRGPTNVPGTFAISKFVRQSDIHLLS